MNVGGYVGAYVGTYVGFDAFVGSICNMMTNATIPNSRRLQNNATPWIPGMILSRLSKPKLREDET